MEVGPVTHSSDISIEHGFSSEAVECGKGEKGSATKGSVDISVVRTVEIGAEVGVSPVAVSAPVYSNTETIGSQSVPFEHNCCWCPTDGGKK